MSCAKWRLLFICIIPNFQNCACYEKSMDNKHTRLHVTGSNVFSGGRKRAEKNERRGARTKFEKGNGKM